MALFKLEKDKRKILVFEAIKEIGEFALRKWREIALESITSYGRFTAALSGGKTPLPFYKSLAGYGPGLPWRKTHIFFVDERFVPRSNPQSNFSMIKNNLLEKVDIPAANIHPVYFQNTAGESVSKYEKDIIDFFRLEDNQKPQFDLIILGVGEDGHTASLFPGHGALLENRRLVIDVTSRDIRFKRITFTLPVLNNARNIIFLITGSNKAGPVKEIIEKGNDSLPASLVKVDRGTLFYLIDKEAASGIDCKGCK